MKQQNDQLEVIQSRHFGSPIQSRSPRSPAQPYSPSSHAKLNSSPSPIKPRSTPSPLKPYSPPPSVEPHSPLSPAKPRSPPSPVKSHSGSPIISPSSSSNHACSPLQSHSPGLSTQLQSPNQSHSPNSSRSPRSPGLFASPKVRYGLYQTPTHTGMRATPVIQRTFKKPASAVTVVKKKQDTIEDQFKRKRIPDWARGDQLKEAVRRQYEAETKYVNK